MSTASITVTTSLASPYATGTEIVSKKILSPSDDALFQSAETSQTSLPYIEHSLADPLQRAAREIACAGLLATSASAPSCEKKAASELPCEAIADGTSETPPSANAGEGSTIRTVTPSSRAAEPSLTESIYDFEAAITSAKPPLSKAPDSTLTEFRKIKHLGRGTFSQVWKVEEVASGVLYALKESLVKKRSDLVFLQREVFYLGNLDHPGIIKLCRFSYTRPHFYTLLEQGPSTTLLMIAGNLNLAQSQYIAAQLSLIIAYLESRRILHRDLKLGNILVSNTCQIKLIDFGFATRLPKEDALVFDLVGTHAYVSPEILLKTGYGKASQWWAFGVCLHTLCFKSYPFGDSTLERGSKEWIASVHRDLSEHQPARIPVDHPLYSSELKALILSLLDYDPTTRAGFKQVKASSWFQGLDWDAIYPPKAIETTV